MAQLKYFTECAGETVELQNVAYTVRPSEFAGCEQTSFVSNLSPRPVFAGSFLIIKNRGLYAAGICPKCGCQHLAARKIKRPADASNHKCSVICRNAKGSSCSCECGGTNHGKGEK